MNHRACFSAVVVLGLCAAIQAADWTHFRGPNRDGKTSDAKLPLEWSKEKNVKWKVKLPSPGNSSPTISGGKIFISAAQDRKGTQRSLICFDRTDGKQLWVKTVNWEQADPTHGTNPQCSPSPATDGERVIVWHGSAGLHCYDFTGKELWKVDLGVFKHIWGYASSPVIHGDKVYLNCGPGPRSFVVCLDKTTGAIAWQTDEPGGAADKEAPDGQWRGSWSSGVITKVDDEDQLIVFQSQHVNAYDLKTGKIIWTCAGTGRLAYTDVMIGEVEGVGKIGIAMAGYGGEAIGFKLGGNGDVTATNRLWQSKGGNPQRIGSGVIIGKHLYMTNEPGIQCIEAATGKVVWNQKSPGGGIWASLIATPDRLYATTQKGSTIVFSPDPTAFKQLAINELGEHINATPTPCDGQFFIRTWENLYCIGE